MKHKLEIIETSNISYSTIINGHTVAAKYVGEKYLKDSMQQDKQKWLLALSKIPKRAKLVLSKDDKKQCVGRLMGGWLCDSGRTVYGILRGMAFSVLHLVLCGYRQRQS